MENKTNSIKENQTNQNNSEQTQYCIEYNLPIDFKIEKWVGKDIVIEALNIINNKTRIALDTSKVLAVEEVVNACDDCNNCTKAFVIYMPSIKIWLRYERRKGIEFVDVNITPYTST